MTAEAKKQTRKEYLRNYQRAWMKKRREKWFAENGPCVQCRSWERLELDHIDPKDKVTHRIWSWSKARFDAEAAKCQVLCEKCHEQKTALDNRSIGTGKPGPTRKLTSDVVQAIRQAAREGDTEAEIAELFGVHKKTVYDILAGKTWAWLDREGGA